ncbi:hypothetical protein RR48_04112 [Papilio machaon]|uniref:Uncharacterized protein n=1 Tax=Papilio machaon TaxID=76193 RepID=A0A0N0PEJ4_PAPMA|nr:hypothetical protein RR48_04112 [Papilio machaon]
MKANKLVIQAFAVILLLQLVDSKSTFDIPNLRSDPLKELSEDIKWLIPVRVKRSAIVYNRCPIGYKRLPPPITCMRCDFCPLSSEVVENGVWLALPGVRIKPNRVSDLSTQISDQTGWSARLIGTKREQESHVDRIPNRLYYKLKTDRLFIS